ncbi:MAG: hypothetical protein ABH874_03470 [Methanobacteriota archaeon]
MSQGEFRGIWKRKEADETALWNILANILLMLLAVIAVILQRGR